MGFRRILAVVGLLLGCSACTPDSPSLQTSGAAASRPGALPPEVERLVGPLYDSPPLQALVDQVGQKLVSASGIGGPFRFYVLDQPIANAHAVSTGYVFVTRGLLALVDDDAELAAAMSHELGHVTQKHAAQRERARKGVMEAAVDAALKSGSVTVGRSVARNGLIELRRYSRDQELEADRVGLGYLVKAGYRGDAIYTLIEKLQRQARLDDLLMGNPDEGEDQRSAMSTHPGPQERMEALRSLPALQQAGASDRARYLSLIDGMSVDDRPDEGFVRGSSFFHPTLRLAFTAPSDFRLFNEREGVFGISGDRSAFFFSCSDDKVPGKMSDFMRETLKPTPTDIQSTTIGGEDAAIGAKPRGSDIGLGQLRYVLIRHGNGLCYFNLLVDGPERDRRIDLLVNATRSFRPLSAAEAASLSPYRLHVMPRNGQSAAQLAQRLPYRDLRLLRLLTLNGVDTEAQFAERREVKIVEP